jgi:hypothetical protein
MSVSAGRDCIIILARGVGTTAIPRFKAQGLNIIMRCKVEYTFAPARLCTYCAFFLFLPFFYGYVFIPLEVKEVQSKLIGHSSLETMLLGRQPLCLHFPTWKYFVGVEHAQYTNFVLG